jgi:two-component system OmpR family response regulator
MRVLLVEDELGLGDAIRSRLTEAGHVVDWVKTLSAANDASESPEYDSVLLDLNLPDGSGLDLLRTMRAAGDIRPVLIVTARDQLSDRLAGLNAGADDYIIKPFHLEELVARLEAVHRRAVGNPNPRLQIGSLSLDKASRQVFLKGEEIAMTGREWALLARLADRPGAIVNKAQLEAALYDLGTEVESNTVEVYVSRLRRKLGRTVITTIRGLGYRLRDRA